ncbi:hypothetical protein ThidrDRAFT_3612 [Thiorhodococcus drewsii AZ1]|uniref:Uncharacterized protein n=1 Tax=Thiorhodococcus drewsii AZ1 TaxID=765913 RepID=G2E5P9_9GAMM|nr:hypothetical protein [Thiorhodococcus drewsii]EGV28620.1 hypothetical protein ThidrDRAFT_3612 [Thiorhodococcus drewsii AZ1]
MDDLNALRDHVGDELNARNSQYLTFLLAIAELAANGDNPNREEQLLIDEAFESATNSLTVGLSGTDRVLVACSAIRLHMRLNGKGVSVPRALSGVERHARYTVASTEGCEG